MDKNLIVLPLRSDGIQPAPARPLIFFIGGKRYQLRIDVKITPVRDKPADLIPIDRGNTSKR
jgi:hypothetical protein